MTPPDRRDRGLGGDQVEGVQAVRELLRARRRQVRRVWIARDADEELEALALAAGARVRRVSRDELAARARTEVPQGVVAEAAPLVEATLDPLLADPAAFLVALDGVTDPGNLGTILRTAEATGATGALLPRHRSARVTPTVAKAAAGAVEHLPVARVSGVPAALERAKRAGVWSVGLDEEAEMPIGDVTVLDAPVIVVLGAEGRGLAPLTRRRCDVLATIPTCGRIGSLNVAAAAAIACYEVARRRSD